MNAAVLTVPVKATYRIIDGEAVIIDAVYADVPADLIARLLMRGFGVPFAEQQQNKSS